MDEQRRRVEKAVGVSGARECNNTSCEEVIELEDQIKKAYVLKALDAQRALQEANRMAMDIQARIADEIATYRSYVSGKARDLSAQAEHERRARELKSALQQQVEEKHRERELQREEEQRERQLLIQIDRVRDEKELYIKTRVKEQLANQQLLELLIQNEMRDIDMEKLEELDFDKELKDESYVQELDRRAAELKKLRAEARQKREEAISAVAEIMVKLENERNERRRLLTDLMLEEVAFDSKLEAKEAELRRRQKMHDLAEVLEEQIRFEAECRRRFLEREKLYAEAIMEKVMQSEKMERLSVETRRRRKIEYRAELQHLMKERERERTLVLERLRGEFQEELRQVQLRKEEAKRARKSLLEKHVDHIAEFMNSKLLSDDERQIIRDKLKNP